MKTPINKISLAAMAIVAIAFIGCRAETSKDILGAFSVAYFDFYYTKSNPKESANGMKSAIDKISLFPQDERISVYIEIYVLHYRLDGGMLSLLRTAISKNEDTSPLLGSVGKMMETVFHPRDKERIESMKLFVESIQDNTDTE